MAPEPKELVEVSIPEQRRFNDILFPLVLSPADPAAFEEASTQNGHHPPSESSPPQLPSEAAKKFASWLATHKSWLEDKWQHHGAVLLRGLPLATAADFDAVVSALGYPELPYVGGAAPRTNVVGRVFTSNESPPDQKIPFHHEMAQVPEFPARLFFFCEVPPSEGGETPILLSHEVTALMQAKHPEFVQSLREKGLRYVRVLGEGDDKTSAIGRGWQSTFLTKDKAEAEAKSANLGVSLEWQADGSARTVSGVLPALRVDKNTGREAWFNSMVAAFTGWNDSRNEGEKAVLFGDGELLPKEAVLDCDRIMAEVSVAVPWQAGDLLLVDNHTVQHSRKSFVPPRRVLASLAK